jgi:Domain of unknown function DUF29
MPDGPTYEDDFYAWTQHQAEVLRTMPVADKRFDREHVAEEIENLGESERDAVRSQIRRIIEHLLKLAYSPAEQPRANWMETIDEARETLSDKLTATLRRKGEGGLEKLYAEGFGRRSSPDDEPDGGDCDPARYGRNRRPMGRRIELSDPRHRLVGTVGASRVDHPPGHAPRRSQPASTVAEPANGG